jgi:hypothetical protein
MILDAHTERVDEDCEKYSLLEVLVLNYGLDDLTDTPETGVATGGYPPPGHPAIVMPVVSLGASTPFQYHDPISTAGLFVATELMFWAVAPSVRGSLVISQRVQTYKICKMLKLSTRIS